MTRTQHLLCLAAATAVATALLAIPADAAKKKSLAKASPGGREPISVVARNPYLSAIAVDAVNGTVLFEDNADTPGYPASMVKLMDLLILLEKIEKGAVKLTDKVEVNAEVSHIGGSRVYLKEHEVFSVDDLLYAMIIQSANDAATALALHVAGSKEGFVQLMNERAAALGMKSTKFSSVHGLPPQKGTQPDLTTARDMTLLCRELFKHPETFRYTSAKVRTFRENPLFIMRTHNHLLGVVNGCDGLKTGYYTAAGFSICGTALRGERRVLAVVMGSTDPKVRDAKAAEIINTAFLKLPPPPPPPPVITNLVVAVTNKVEAPKPVERKDGPSKLRLAMYILLPLVLIAIIARFFSLSSITKH